MQVNEAAGAFAAGEMTFRRFAQETDPLWEWWARRIAKVGLPSWFDVDDIRQELLIEAWRAAQRFSSAKSNGKKPGAWVQFAAQKAAIKAAHRARGDKRHRWEWGPMRADIPISSLLPADADPDMADVFEVPVEATQEEQAEKNKALLKYARSQGSIRDFFAVLAIGKADGDIDEAARLIYADLDARLLCRLGSEKQARAIVSSAAVRIAA